MASSPVTAASLEMADPRNHSSNNNGEKAVDNDHDNDDETSVNYIITEQSSESTLRSTATSGLGLGSLDEIPISYQYLTFETDLPTPRRFIHYSQQQEEQQQQQHGSNPNAAPQSLQQSLPQPQLQLQPSLPFPPTCPDLKPFTNPFTWSRSRKNFVTWLSCATTITAAYSAGSYEFAADQLTSAWNISTVAFNVGITIFTVGFGFAPMALAPFSEEYGRRPVMMASGLVYVVGQLGCALANGYGGMLAARFFVGVGGSTFSTMVGGILADIWVSKERNTPMTIFVGATLVGTGLGPLVSGFVAQNISWRWIFYIQAIVCGLVIAAVCLFFKETRGSTLLSRKARAINKWYDELEAAGFMVILDSRAEEHAESEGKSDSTSEEENNDNKHKKLPQPPRRQRIRWLVKSDENRASLGRMIRLSLTRPFHLLFTESVVFWFSLWVSFSWAILYLQFGAVPLVFQRNHAFTVQQVGSLFAAVVVGGVLSTFLSIYQESLARRCFPARVWAAPEARLYFACVESILMPIGLFVFGWTSSAAVAWPAPAVAVAVATMGIFSIYLATFNFLADCYHRYASSALAAQSLCRNLLGGAFPLVTVQMFTRLGFPAASSLLGGVAVVLTLVPWVLILFGPRIRARSPFASEIMRLPA